MSSAVYPGWYNNNTHSTLSVKDSGTGSPGEIPAILRHDVLCGHRPATAAVHY